MTDSLKYPGDYWFRIIGSHWPHAPFVPHEEADFWAAAARSDLRRTRSSKVSVVNGTLVRDTDPIKEGRIIGTDGPS